MVNGRHKVYQTIRQDFASCCCVELRWVNVVAHTIDMHDSIAQFIARRRLQLASTKEPLIVIIVGRALLCDESLNCWLLVVSAREVSPLGNVSAEFFLHGNADPFSHNSFSKRVAITY